MSVPWEGLIPEEEIRRYEAAGFGRKARPGKRPGLLIIDVQYRTIGTEPKPFWEAVEEFATSCGQVGWDAMANIQRLLKVFRDNEWPVLYPHVAPKEKFDQGRLAEKNPALMKVAAKGYDFPEEIAPQPNDVLLPKKHPSAFFGTPLTSYLIERGIDTLVVTGCTTSGCVRGSVVDAFANNFSVLVPHDAVYDRSQVSHAVNLFDMSEKYANVGTTDEVLGTLKDIENV
ncbi:isochorismatase family protein [Roseovarius sp. SK2]|uniref:isochorismatase family protein n=1 Tax=Roseovarius TaxID=74030 RepID=UPI00237B59E0|nr:MULTISPECIES: isochorismatase family protein [unclassified Roseovarius]MDD9725706.1 isochorismatase family protein [Roseovarius sp. SK2]